MQGSSVIVFKSQDGERNCEQAWAKSAKPGTKHHGAKKQRYRSSYSIDVEPLRTGKGCGDRAYGNRVPRNRTGIQPPATIRFRHRFPNVNKKPARGKAALRLGGVLKVVREGTPQSADCPVVSQNDTKH